MGNTIKKIEPCSECGSKTSYKFKNRYGYDWYRIKGKRFCRYCFRKNSIKYQVWKKEERIKNKEYYNNYSKKYYQEHKEAILKYLKKYYKKNKKKYAKYAKLYWKRKKMELKAQGGKDERHC